MTRSGKTSRLPRKPGGRITVTRCDASYNIWQSPHVDGIELIESNLHLHYYPDHLHDSMEVIWIQAGSATINCRGTRYTIGAGEACFIAANEIHSGCGSDNRAFSFLSVQIRKSLLDALPGDRLVLHDGLGNPVPIKIVAKETADRYLPRLIDGLAAARDLAELGSCVDDVLVRLFNSPTMIRCPAFDKAYRHPVVDRAKAIIRAHCVPGVKIHDLADVVRLDVRYLIPLFKSGTGLTPHQFQIAVRVDQARRLIQQDIPLREVALITGFSDQSHLNRHFRRQYGYSPGSFRHSVGNRPVPDFAAS